MGRTTDSFKQEIGKMLERQSAIGFSAMPMLTPYCRVDKTKAAEIEARKAMDIIPYGGL